MSRDVAGSSPTIDEVLRSERHVRELLSPTLVGNGADLNEASRRIAGAAITSGRFELQLEIEAAAYAAEKVLERADDDFLGELAVYHASRLGVYRAVGGESDDAWDRADDDVENFADAILADRRRLAEDDALVAARTAARTERSRLARLSWAPLERALVVAPCIRRIRGRRPSRSSRRPSRRRSTATRGSPRRKAEREPHLAAGPA